MSVRDAGLVAIGAIVGAFATMSLMVGMALDYERTDRTFRAIRARYGEHLERKPSP